VVKPTVRQALRPHTRKAARPAGRSRARGEAPVVAPESAAAAVPNGSWRLGPQPKALAVQAVRAADDIFQGQPAARDAALGWLFARLPSLGGEGDDMVAHHARLTSDRYYAQWGELCRRLGLFGRDA